MMTLNQELMIHCEAGWYGECHNTAYITLFEQWHCFKKSFKTLKAI